MTCGLITTNIDWKFEMSVSNLDSKGSTMTAVLRSWGMVVFLLSISFSALAISNDEIHQAIVPHQYEIQVCYKNAVVRVPGLAGKLQVNFELDDKGKASKFTADSSSEIKDKVFIDCVLGKMPFWQFPKAPEGSKVVASYQFAFSSK